MRIHENHPFKRFLLTLLLGAVSMQCVSCEKEMPRDVADSTPPVAQTSKTVEIPPEPAMSEPEYYKNPLIKANAQNTWPDYGVGDPFVMRWNGRYYLYCSTKDGEVGIQCWVSDDLVNWDYNGICAAQALTESAYAPEVMYENGFFYMYTSPAGNGHYILKSDSPTGPFTAVTENFGLSIDGDVFVDDDGSWRFYTAGNDGIMSYTMPAPDKVDTSSGVHIPCDMHGWTEGSMIVKHNGIYYMTYAGNHVWSAGYRIHYAVSDTSPVAFRAAENNPLLLSTNRKTVMGIGHSSTVVGPNLDEYYIVYHSHKTPPKRDMNIDRIVFNGTGTVVLGPTTGSQLTPAFPDVWCRFEKENELDGWDVVNGSFLQKTFTLREGGQVLSAYQLNGDYTAEYNLKSISDRAGILFGYTDAQNHARAIYDADEGLLTVSFIENGTATENRISLSASFGQPLDNQALIKFTVRRSGNTYTLFVNNREVLQCRSTRKGGSIGVVCEKGTAALGFVGGTNDALQSSLKKVYKPIESTIPAFTCMQTDVRYTKHGITEYLCADTDGEYTYRTNVSIGDSYDLVMEYRADTVCTVEVSQNGVPIGEITLPAAKNRTARAVKRGFALCDGLGTLSFRIKEGSADLLNFSFHRAENTPETTYTFDTPTVASYKDGEWITQQGALVFKGGFGKYMVGSENWGDYVVETDITLTADTVNAGLCVRVSNPATVEPGSNYPAGGSDFLQGYFIGIGDNSLVLGKHNYDWTELKRVEYVFEKGKTYRLKAEVNQNVLRISVDGNLLIQYKDNNAPFLHGMVGYRAHASSITADNLIIRPIE